LLQTANHTNTSSLNYYRLDILPDTQPTVLERFLKMLEFGIKTSRPFESA